MRDVHGEKLFELRQHGSCLAGVPTVILELSHDLPLPRYVMLA